MQFPLKKIILLRAWRNISFSSPKPNHFTRLHFFFHLTFFFLIEPILSASEKLLLFKNCLSNTRCPRMCILNNQNNSVTYSSCLFHTYFQLMTHWFKEDKCELRAKQRTWCACAWEEDESRSCWQSIAGRGACLKGLNDPHCSLSWPHSQTHMQPHANTCPKHHSLFTLEAPWTYFRLEGMPIIKKGTVLEAITWYMNTSEGPKMLAVAFSFSIFKEFYFPLSFHHLFFVLQQMSFPMEFNSIWNGIVLQQILM